MDCAPLPDVDVAKDAARQMLALRVLRMVADKPDLTQRQLAEALGVSLGGINYCINALVDKGHIKINNFRKSNNKIGYIYVLTPSGAAEKLALAGFFLNRKMAEYEMLRSEIEAVRLEFDAVSNQRTSKMSENPVANK